MQQPICYKSFPQWNSADLANQFQNNLYNPAYSSANLIVLQGKVDVTLYDEQGRMVLSTIVDSQNSPLTILQSCNIHLRSLHPKTQCQLSLFCDLAHYSALKYELTPTHSEVLSATQLIHSGKALDLGCGSGRNALYLHKLGFDVTAYDKSQPNIMRLNQIIESEALTHFKAQAYDINLATLDDRYDLIISTVVMMFLAAHRIPEIIHNMQSCTQVGGYNLIVSAMSTDDFPCTVPFSFTFKENELRNYYQDWEIIKYNEDVGELHRRDENGDRIKLRFATLLAKKK